MNFANWACMMYTCSVFSMHNFNEFIEYVLSFYGDGGLYDQKRTKEQIAYATTVYLDTCAVDPMVNWGNGDSLDRERVRDIMNQIYDAVPATPANMEWVSQYA